MHLKSLTIKNFRKFGTVDNIIEFVQSESNNKNISSSTTLIVGKNNVGKTTIIDALRQIIENPGLTGNNFNYKYLKDLLSKYKNNNEFSETPSLSFIITFGFDAKNSNLEYIQNFADFINVQQCSQGLNELKILISYNVKEDQVFLDGIRKILAKHKAVDDGQYLFRKFIKLIDDTKFKILYFDEDGQARGMSNFKLRELIELKYISAKRKHSEDNLSNVFNKIVKFRYGLEKHSKQLDQLEEQMSEINSNITAHVGEAHQDSVNHVLSQIVSKEKLGVNLRSDLNFDSLLTSLIRYEFSEVGELIPESQFGLGYASLMTILGELIEYVERYSDENIQNKINLIFIEEPETFMHPQMQELFIKCIEGAVSALLLRSGKNINSQLVITTHSSHILNSKIHYSNTFNNINYMTSVKNYCHVVPLNDEIIQERAKKPSREKDLIFLKKHIKYKISEIFFSDATIFVEGITEETLLSHYIDRNDELKLHYISIFNINGAYAHIYYPLIKLLKIPCLVITDLDVKREDSENWKKIVDEYGKEHKIKIYSKITSLQMRETTNEVIRLFLLGKNVTTKVPRLKQLKTLDTIVNYHEEDNFKIVFQKDKIENCYAASFEEAFILHNYSNKMLNRALSTVRRDIYRDIVGKGNNKDEYRLVERSYELQSKLSEHKSEFANTMLYELETGTSEPPALPKYIEDGFKWLVTMLVDNTKPDSVLNELSARSVQVEAEGGSHA